MRSSSAPKEAGGPLRDGHRAVTKSRRIDNQLRGRSGRQGDPGRSKFYLSLQDDLMRILRLRPDGEHAHQASASMRASRSPTPGSTRRSKRRSRRSRLRNFDIRKKHSSNTTRHERPAQGRIRGQRREFMAEESVREDHRRTCDQTLVDDIVARHIPTDAYPRAMGRGRPQGRCTDHSQSRLTRG